MVNYNQACQRPDGSIYGIEDGKQCLKGAKVSLSTVRSQSKEQLTNAVKEARARGASLETIKKTLTGSSNTQEAIATLNSIKPRFDDPNDLVNLARSNHNSEFEKIDKYLKGTKGYNLFELSAFIYYAKSDLKTSPSGDEEKVIRDTLKRIALVRKAEEEMALLREKLLQKGSLSESKQMTVRVLKNSPLNNLPRPVKEYAETLIDLNRISNGQVKDLDKLYYTDERAFSVKKGTKIEGEESDRDGRINVGYQENRSELRKDLWHEFGHQLEDSIPEYNKAAIQWLKSRSNGTIVKIKDLGENYDQYGDDELVYLGDFFDAYVGKFYPDGATEVISMGLEMFSSPRSMVSFYQKDPEHFFFILGILNQL